MAFVRCRECGHEIKADTKQTRCEQCGTFFPFTCAVCDKFLRPPFAAYDDERYVTEDNRPLCQDHYQRQCPQCKKWFQADQNPGYFLCPDCARARQQQREAVSVAVAQPVAAPVAADAERGEIEVGKRTTVSAMDYVVFAMIFCAALVGLAFLLMRVLGTGGG